MLSGIWLADEYVSEGAAIRQDSVSQFRHARVVNEGRESQLRVSAWFTDEVVEGKAAEAIDAGQGGFGGFGIKFKTQKSRCSAEPAEDTQLKSLHIDFDKIGHPERVN